MIFSVLSVILYLIALGFSGWFALLSHKTGWQVLAGILAVAGAFVLVKSLWTVLSSVISRLRFCSGLRRRAEQSGMVYTRLHAPLASFFRVYAGADVLLQSSGRTPRIKFSRTLRKNTWCTLRMPGMPFSPSSGLCCLSPGTLRGQALAGADRCQRN